MLYHTWTITMVFGSTWISLMFLLAVAESANPTFIHDMHQQLMKHNISLDNFASTADQPFQGLFKMIVDRVKQSESASLQRILTNSSIHNDNDVSFACLNDTEKVIEDLFTSQQYAFKFIDADAKIPSGILQGQWQWTGDYHECINIESPFNIHTNHNFKGKYYTARIDSSLIPSGIAIGVCLPDSCSRADASSLVNIAFFSSSKQQVVQNIYTSDRISMDTGDTVAIVICCLILTTVTVGSLIDYIHQKQHSNNKTDTDTRNGYVDMEREINERSGLLANTDLIVNKTANNRSTIMNKIFAGLKTFSVFTNTKKLMNTSTANGPLACLNGLRVISMCWVIQGHTYEFILMVMKDALYMEHTLVGRFSFQAILNGTYSVDTFFFLSGLLVAYLSMRELSVKGKLNWIYYFVHRYWRLTPIYAFCMLFFTTLYTLMFTGPFIWAALDPSGPIYSAINDCHTYWWSNLLYINNFYPDYGSTTTCMGWAWYLANDMQFYVFLSPLVIILLHKNKKVGIAFCIFLIAACIGSRAFIAQYYGMNQNRDISKHKDDPWGQNGPLYTKPYARWSVYIVGMLTGYLLQATKCKIRLHYFYTLIGWVVSISMGLSVVYGLYHFNRTGTNMSQTGSIFYISFARTLWSISLSWLVIACATGRGGWINAILSWKVWASLGRLTYAAYLVHPMVLVAFNLTYVAPIAFTDLMLVYVFIGNVVLSYAAAYVVSMAVEAPMMQLEKLVLNRS